MRRSEGRRGLGGKRLKYSITGKQWTGFRRRLGGGEEGGTAQCSVVSAQRSEKRAGEYHTWPVGSGFAGLGRMNYEGRRIGGCNFGKEVSLITLLRGVEIGTFKRRGLLLAASFVGESLLKAPLFARETWLAR